MGLKPFSNSLPATCRPSKGVTWSLHGFSTSEQSHISTCLEVPCLSNSVVTISRLPKRKFKEEFRTETHCIFRFRSDALEKRGLTVGVKIFIIRILRSLILYGVMRVVRNWFPISDSLPNYFKWYPNEPNVRRDEDLRTKWGMNRLLHQRMIRASRSNQLNGSHGLFPGFTDHD